MLDQKTFDLALSTQALHELDQRLAVIGERITIRAIGGYAMLLHGLRTDTPYSTTCDIDTITSTYRDTVTSLIRDVASEYGLEPDWINNDTIYSPLDEVTDEDVEAFEFLVNAFFAPVQTTFTNIDLEVASLETLARTKLYAVADAFEGIAKGRNSDKDLDDFVHILRALNVQTEENLLAICPVIKEPEMEPVREKLDTILKMV